MPLAPERLRVIDTHTGGEPTRVIVEGGPDLGRGTMAERRERFREQFDRYRTAVLSEPRGSSVMVGALLVPPADPSCVAGVIYFNDVGYLNMCGHGTIGVAAALAYHTGLRPGVHRLETPVGAVKIDLETPTRATIENVPSYRLAANVPVPVPNYGEVLGDIAWGGNWFFLIGNPPCTVEPPNIESLTAFTRAVRDSLRREGITGAEGAEIDHIEVFGPPADPENDSRNFVLCPGAAYDRSPCGTGTSAKLACLFAEGKLKPGQVWRQESIVGSLFEGRVRLEENRLIPCITGTAYVNGDCTLLLDPDDPFRWGIR